MKVDLRKPIQLKGGRKANYIRDTPDGKRIIEWRSWSGYWYVDGYLDGDVDAAYENVPSPPRKVKVWVVWTTSEDPYTTLSEDAARDARKYLQGVQVTEHEIEEPTP